jgi:hypothetical protein
MLLGKIKAAKNDYSVIYKELTDYFKVHVGQQTFGHVSGGIDKSLSLTTSSSGGGTYIASSSYFVDGTTSFKWDKSRCGNGIEIGNNGLSCFLKEGPYMFRTVLGDVVMKMNPQVNSYRVLKKEFITGKFMLTAELITN